jgi:monoamine oxidase
MMDPTNVENDPTKPTYTSHRRCAWTCCPLPPFWCRLWTRRLVGLTTLVVFIGLWIAAAVLSSPIEAYVPPLQLLENSQTAFSGRVVIVGAGASGMFAAYTLTYLGVDKYDILEASPDSFGGRTLELDDFVDMPLDLGAEWIHADPKVLHDLLLFDDTNEEEGLPKTIVYQPETWSAFSDGWLYSRNWVRFFYAEHKFFNSTWWSYLNRFIYPYVASHLQLNAAVQTIDSTDPNVVMVTTTDGQVFEADHVIIAVPISILQQGDIDFLPALPTKKERAISKVNMVPGLKVWLEFDTDFYPDITIPGKLITGLSEDKLYFDALWGKKSNHHVLALFAVGWQANEYVGLEDDEILDHILNELDQIFDGKASQHYLNKHHVQNWSEKPYVKGAYSYNRRDYWDDIGTLRASIDQRIYFCGEYLAEYSATVHGAAISGRNVAKRVVLDTNILATSE